MYSKTVELQVQNMIISPQHLHCFIIELFLFFLSLTQQLPSFCTMVLPDCNQMYKMCCVKNKETKISNSFCFQQHSCLITACPHLPAAPSRLLLCRRGKKHPSIPRAEQDEGLLLYRQPGPGGGLQDQDCGEVPMVCLERSLL